MRRDNSVLCSSPRKFNGSIASILLLCNQTLLLLLLKKPLSMENSSQGPTSFSTQANALLRKNLTFQKHNLKANIALVTYPVFLCLLLVLIQTAVNYELDKDTKNKCGCTCVDRNGDGRCEKVCGIEYSSLDQAGSCPLPTPPRFPALLQVPGPKFRAVGTGFMPFTDLPDESCRDTGSCPAIILLTGRNRSLGEGLAGNLFTSDFSADSFDGLKSLTNLLTVVSLYFIIIVFVFVIRITLYLEKHGGNINR